MGIMWGLFSVALLLMVWIGSIQANRYIHEGRMCRSREIQVLQKEQEKWFGKESGSMTNLEAREA